MPTFGGLSPFPLRFGGKGTGPRLQRILESLNLARGTAYDTTSTSTVYAENQALARCINAAWGTNARLANTFDPQRVTGVMLGRWEKIMGLVPAPTDSEATRRLRLVANWQRWGSKFNTSLLINTVTTLLGSTLVAVQFDTPTGAGTTTFWPGGTTSIYAPWMSTVYRIRFQVVQPSGMLDGDFYRIVNSANQFMDGQAPAHITWEWWREDLAGIGGGFHFYLDSLRNLDNDAFDS